MLKDFFGITHLIWKNLGLPLKSKTPIQIHKQLSVAKSWRN